MIDIMTMRTAQNEIIIMTMLNETMTEITTTTTTITNIPRCPKIPGSIAIMMTLGDVSETTRPAENFKLRNLEFTNE